MLFRFLNRLNATTGLFNGHYVDAKAFYVLRFREIPSITFIGEIDVTKAFDYILEDIGTKITAIYRHSFFNHADKSVYFNNAIIVLANKRMIEVAENYCQLLYTVDNYVWADQFAADLAQFRNEKDFAAYTHIPVVGFAKATEMN